MNIEHGILMVWFAAILALTACGEKEQPGIGAVVSQASMDVVTPVVKPVEVIKVEEKPIVKPKNWMGDSCYVVPGCIEAIRKLEKEWNK